MMKFCCRYTKSADKQSVDSPDEWTGNEQKPLRCYYFRETIQIFSSAWIVLYIQRKERDLHHHVGDRHADSRHYSVEKYLVCCCSGNKKSRDQGNDDP